MQHTCEDKILQTLQSTRVDSFVVAIEDLKEVFSGSFMLRCRSSIVAELVTTSHELFRFWLGEEIDKG
jgi:hypothetical protein